MIRHDTSPILKYSGITDPRPFVHKQTLLRPSKQAVPKPGRIWPFPHIQIGGGRDVLPWEVALVGLPPPILVLQIPSPKLFTGQLIRHVRALPLGIQRVGHIVKHPSP